MSRWEHFFGNPEKAARTIEQKGMVFDLLDHCDACEKFSGDCLRLTGKCRMESFESILEWLVGDGE